ncbi:MAG: 50S ribosomal protein L18 [Chlamydiae bacterium]|nr:50S ribosomal protein L18 [Chlamydiota bacterium]
MESRLVKRNVQRSRRLLRVRKKVRGSSEKPRLSVFKSNRHISVQLIDDEKSLTIASASTLQDKSLEGKSKESARKLGALIAELAKKNNVNSVVFDRGHHKYHGLLAELANAARESGLQF